MRGIFEETITLTKMAYREKMKAMSFTLRNCRNTLMSKDRPSLTWRRVKEMGKEAEKEALQMLKELMEGQSELRGEFKKLNERFDKVEERLNKRFDKIENELGEIKDHLTSIQKINSDIIETCKEINHNLKDTKKCDG